MSGRIAGIAAFVILGVAAGSQLLDREEAAGVAAALLMATLAVAIVPGALITILWAPRSRITLLETIGFGLAISFGLVQLSTIVVISLHLPIYVPLITLVIGSVVIGFLAFRRPAARIVIASDELIVLLLLCALGASLYNLGSPVDGFEDQVHIAVIQRLAAVESPRLENIYFAPGIIYTYPFPGTHYFMALVARLAGLDPLFVYHKLRFLWGPVALILLYLLARPVFGQRGVASAVAITGAMLVANGTFAMVPGFASGWGQLAPYSHASDVAMTVLLPALMVMAFGYLLAESTRERAFFATATTMLLLMLTVVHIREIVQFAVYAACFLVVTLAVRPFRRYVVRTAGLLVLVVGIAALYRLWQAHAIALVNDLIGERRGEVASLYRENSLRTLIFTPASALLGSRLIHIEESFAGFMPLFLFAGPAVVVAFARQPLVWLMGASTVVYLALMTIPLLAIPYIYLTYFEILYTPIRNVIVFVYLVAGAAIYGVVIALTRVDRTRLSLLAAGLCAGVLGVVVSLGVNQTPGGFFVPLIVAYSLALVMTWLGSRLKPRIRAAVITVGAAIGLITLLPQRDAVHPPVHLSVRWTAGLPDTERALLERRFTLTAGEPNSNYSDQINVWNYAVSDTSTENVRALVMHPQVVDTNGIDRSTFTIVDEPVLPPENAHLAVSHLRWLQYPEVPLFWAATLFLWVLGFLAPAWLVLDSMRQPAFVAMPASDVPFYRRGLPYVLFIVPFAVASARPSLSPLVAASSTASAATPRAMIAGSRCVMTPRTAAPYSEDLVGSEGLILLPRLACAPDYDLVQWVRRNVPTEAVFAINKWNGHLPTMFMPQRVVVYPQTERSFENEHELFPTYYRFYDDSIRRYRVQPFFNSTETLDEREAFVEALAVTHVLVDPAYYEELRPVLDNLPQRFRLRYSNGTWAVYELVSRTGANGSPG